MKRQTYIMMKKKDKHENTESIYIQQQGIPIHKAKIL